MDVTDTPDRAALRELLRDFLGEHAAAERVRQVLAEPAGCDTVAWRRLGGELGLTGLAVPERHGGAGATLAEVAVVVEELGRTLLPVPYLPSALAAALLAEEDDADAAAAFLPGLVDGTLVAAYAPADDGVVAGGRVSGTARNVLYGPHADILLVGADADLVAVRASDAMVTPVDTLDQTRRQASVELLDAPCLPLSVPAGRAEDLVRTALAVEAVGAAQHCLEATVAYLKARVQFGRPIGSFQALKHRAADLAVEVESARATAWAAVRAAVADPAELAVLGPLAKRNCADVCWHVAAEMVQLHGGIGFTWEHEAHLYLKRAKATQLLHGSSSELRTLVGRRAGLLP